MAFGMIVFVKHGLGFLFFKAGFIPVLEDCYGCELSMVSFGANALFQGLQVA